jgi:hypothetical protein
MAKTVEELQAIIDSYEQDGAAKLFYAINKKMNQMAALLNRVDLQNIDLADKDSKSFDRIFKLLEKSQVISAAAQTIYSFAGITNDEEKDTQSPKFRITPESMADEVGDLAGSKSSN